MAIATEHDLTDEQKRLLHMVRSKWEAADKLHAQYRPRWDSFYGLSRNYRNLRASHAQAQSQRDRDIVLEEGRREFGTELFIPYCFTVIETNVPRIFASSPAMSVLPLDEAAQESCPRLKHLYKRDADKIDFETTLQEVIRSGLRYGLGVMKTYWGEDHRLRPSVKSRLLGMGSRTELERVCIHAGPQAEAVDIYDLRWDPAAKSIRRCGYLIHRTWLSTSEVADRVKEGRERRARGETGGWFDLDLEKVKGLSSEAAWGEVRAGRMEAAGIASFDTSGEDKHEVWEYHDGENVYTVLDRCLLVQAARNPYYHCELPFQAYRPTIVEHEFVGMGEVEPAAHLQYELNLLRGQRRDAASLALNRGYFYQVGMLDPAKMVTGVGVFNPVFGNPSEIVQPMPFQDLPQSSVLEEEALKADIELTSAMSESAIGSGGESTATGTQLVQAAANLRVRQKTKNALKQLVKPAGDQWLEMYRQHIHADAEEPERSVRVEDKQAEQGYAFINVTPEDVQANVEVFPDDSSMEPDNSQQKRADARELAVALAPFSEKIDTGALIKYLLVQYGIETPDEWIIHGAEPEQIVNAIAQTMVEAEFPEEIVTEILQSALERVEQEPPGGEEPETTSPAGAVA